MTVGQPVLKDEGGRSKLLLVIARSGHEIALFFAAIGLCVVALALISHSPNDPAWSTTGTGAPIENWLREPGAALSNVVYFVFGFSGWWLYLICWRLWFRSLKQRLSSANSSSIDQRSPHAVSRAFVEWLRYAPLYRLRDALMLSLLMCASAVLEWGRLYQYETFLPDHAGGVLGRVLGPWMMAGVGMNGSALLAIAVLIVSVAYVFGFSWLFWAEAIGRFLDQLWLILYGQWQSRQDTLIGREAVRHRDDEPFFDPHLPASVMTATDAVPELSVNTNTNSFVSADISPQEKAEKAINSEVPTNVNVTDDVLASQWSVEDNQADESFGAQPKSVDDRLSEIEQIFKQIEEPPPIEVQKELENSAQNLPSASETELDLDLSVDEDLLSFDEPAKVQGEDKKTSSDVTHIWQMQATRPSRPSQPSVVQHQPFLDMSLVSELEHPHIDLLDLPSVSQELVSAATLESTSRLIEQKLKDFGVSVKVVAAAPGPVVTRYEIEPATGVKGAQIVNLSKDLARSLSLISIRVIETIPGKNLMALELPNPRRQTIRLSEVLGADVYQKASSLLTMGLGKDIVGQPVVADLAKMPHCLVAGTTGSGKSVGINAMILSLLFRAHPDDVRLMLIDPKMLEMSVYEGIPHLLCPVVTDMKQAANGLNWCVAEMEKRYKLMSKLGVRNLAGYNTKIDDARAKEEYIPNPFSLTPEQPEPLERLPYIVVVIDELADLMMVVGKKIEELIARLAQKARAAGIHLILATQRPSVDVITGLIKANVPTRISFQVSSKIDSRTILDQMGAEALLGMGDMLYMPSGTGYPIRVHGAFVSDDEVHRVVAHLTEQCGEPNYIEGILEPQIGEGEGFDAEASGLGNSSEKDPLYDQAVEIVLRDRKASISYVQRKLQVGYNRSARLLEEMEQAGLVSAMTSRGQRDILVPQRPQ